MDPEGRSDELNQRWLILDLAVTKQLGSRDVPATPVRVDSYQVVDSLQNMFARFENLKFDHG